MQNGTPNGASQHDERVTPIPTEDLRVSPKPEPAETVVTLVQAPSEQKHDEIVEAHVEGPPSKKRKLADSKRSTPRPVSPPWKKAGIDGPTSFMEGGRRKSSRTNAIPLEMQPPSAIRQTRGIQKDSATKATSTRQTPTVSSPLSLKPVRASGRKSSLGARAASNGTASNIERRESKRKSSSRLSVGRGANIEASLPASDSAKARRRSQNAANLHGRVQTTVNGVSPRYTRRNASISTTESPSVSRDLKSPSQSDAYEFTGGHKLPRIRLKFKKGSVSVQHPGHVVPSKHYPSFRDWVYNTDVLAGENVITTTEDAEEEAIKRLRVLEAGEPGGLLSPQVCSACLPEPQEEPPIQYSHYDHLVAHALYFRKLLDQEHRRHRNTARQLAYWCAEAWRKRNKRPEDILREQEEEMKAKRKQVIRDLQKQFDLVRAEVDRVRLARWEEERKAENQQALNQAIKQSTMLFEKRRQEILGIGSDMDAFSEDIDDDDKDLEEDEDDDEEDEETSLSDADESNMSSSESDSEGDNLPDDDEGLTAEELRLKYANLPDTTFANNASDDSRLDSSSRGTPSVEDGHTEGDTSVAPSITHADLDEVDPVMLDDSDESTDMEDDLGDSDDMSDEQSDDDDESTASDDGPGLFGFFSSKDPLLASGMNNTEDEQDEKNKGSVDDAENEDADEVTLIPTGSSEESDQEANKLGGAKSESQRDEESSRAVAEGEQMDVDKQEFPTRDGEGNNESRHSGDASSQASPATVATKPSEPESMSSYEGQMDKQSVTDSPTPAGLKTPIPHLLRGTLREYQHYGLDWLAGLYTNHINGILADEMGLGKTIQTIALLAHLAVEHETWGPHLVVVPTSVILNWEMEFKKWCPGFKIMTYYGNQEERKQKRRGWTDDSSWDVLITSYQLVLQDQQVLKRRNWHYMVLDEAHNIKNFRSQRWQALLTFRTRARLLLTGTPLQNNLTELWSLLFFLMPSDEDGAGVEGFADLRNFSEWFRRPVEQILEHGRETMDEEAKQIVSKLHTVLRPYLLRRLKADVEKQMPAKYEHVVTCRLSKRQRYLYDGFMSRAQTKETLASGNYLSIINCLMQLRKVCNHPDLFETRQISTSFAMPTSVSIDYEIKNTLVRRRLLYQHPFDTLDLEFLNLAPISREDLSTRLVQDSSRIMAFGPLKTLRERQYRRTNWQMGFDGSSVRSILDSMENAARKKRMNELESALYFESHRHGRRPIWGKSLIKFLTIERPYNGFSARDGSSRQISKLDQLANQSSVLASMINSIQDRAQNMEGYIQRFGCVTPAAVAAGTTEAAITPVESRYFGPEIRYQNYDPFHEAQMRLSIAFPDKRLLQYDCGKLQQLDKLLRQLQAGGHRALIFTQMTKMLDILEQFLNIHGHRYLRLDGTTKVEQRQMLTDRFNNDNRILAFILSTRSGGLGINLTGADSVIFYDLDWNPAMDKQCQDRCHRIGQTRDVHIYRFVSEFTIESNILRKANQKRMLDDVVIQEGAFTTDYFTRVNKARAEIDESAPDDQQDEASKAMDRVLDNRGGGVGIAIGSNHPSSRVFEQAEDKEDIDAAKNAQKEMEHADDGDFGDALLPTTTTTTTSLAGDESVAADGAKREQNEEDEEATAEPHHIDDYLVRFMEWNVRDEPLVLPPDKAKKKSKRGKEHRIRRR
ncbi:Helicase swr1 [Talaromyces atroroseus]|uniref:Helicase SWR1 n=1 Tax=Talaromyces atroroseus TaxID=1441469 RepID=A0A225ACA7_TALAT|nr:Helicase swr1 [Talaromyces atroroseus]OKL58751.1 Helicase swr1 [Talaromyces atroroseus]